MRIAAILHPYAKDSLLQPFRAAGLNLFRGNELERNDLPSAVLVFGGDGSVHRVIQALVGSQTPMLVVPTGSGNDFSKSLGIRTYDDALAIWREFVAGRAKTRDIDLGVIRPAVPDTKQASREWVDGTLTFAQSDGSFAKPERPLSADIMRAQLRHVYEELPTEEYFCCVAGAGLDSQSNLLANRMPAWLRSHGGYIISALRALAKFQPTTTTLANTGADDAWTLNKPTMSSPALFVAIANAPTYGNGMRIAPRAALDDSRLDICFVRDMPRLRVLRLFRTIFSGAHVERPEVEYFTATSLRISTERPLPICADGEYICDTPADISLRPNSLRVLIP